MKNHRAFPSRFCVARDSARLLFVRSTVELQAEQRATVSLISQWQLLLGHHRQCRNKDFGALAISRSGTDTIGPDAGGLQVDAIMAGPCRLPLPQRQQAADNTSKTKLQAKGTAQTSMAGDRKRCGWCSVVQAKGDFGLQMNRAGLEISSLPQAQRCEQVERQTTMMQQMHFFLPDVMCHPIQSKGQFRDTRRRQRHGLPTHFLIERFELAGCRFELLRRGGASSLDGVGSGGAGSGKFTFGCWNML